jgi:putative Ca2+/H+ antiporter (TMEM165/GDT1 family)
MQTLLIATGVVALAEIGDKTQLLALLLAARFRRPVPIIAGILLATLANHSLAGALGASLSAWTRPAVLKWVLVISFFVMAAWTLIPDRIEADEARVGQRWGVFGTTLVSFFLAEMGDKTQIATVAMAARFGAPLVVVIGTTLGMLIADVPAVFIGDRLAGRLPMKLIRFIAAGIFATLGVLTLLAV